jgi:hypothetical protein
VHFERTTKVYGPQAAVNLAEVHGKEAVVTSAYREAVTDYNLADVQYVEFDFHAECKGMRYENISKLVNQLQRTFASQGFFWVSGSNVLSQQSGVFRVNCIDCLDRTNVVQSAFARHVLTHQLQAVAIIQDENDVSRQETDVVFNDVWANNGDAISRAYAGTSALKGDYTRTGKRDLSGVLNDGMNSLARMYTGTFSDFFSQAVIDFMLGHRSLAVFSEFLSTLASIDPREVHRLSKIRAVAIESCASLVLTDGERLRKGWTLLAPKELNVKVADRFEEKVLLLSGQALYIVSYDYALEKVQLFTRVPLGDIVSIQHGAYILSPLQESSRDPEENYGLIITYRTAKQTTRISSYSIRNQPVKEIPRRKPLRSLSLRMFGPAASEPLLSPPPVQGTTPKESSPVLSDILSSVSPGEETNFSAFKALPVDTTTDKDVDGLANPSTCREAVMNLVGTIASACQDSGAGDTPDFLQEQAIVSLEEAQKLTSLYAKMEYGFKRLLWLGS